MSGYEDEGIEILERDECLRLLASVPIGRVAFTTKALPAVQPVTFVLHDDQVVFRTRPGSKLDAALRGTIVAFEVDEYDAANQTGWSVTAVGPANLVTDQDRLAELARLPLRPWASGTRRHFVTISVELVNGRRIGRQIKPTDAYSPPSPDLPRNGLLPQTSDG